MTFLTQMLSDETKLVIIVFFFAKRKFRRFPFVKSKFHLNSFYPRNDILWNRLMGLQNPPSIYSSTYLLIPPSICLFLYLLIYSYINLLVNSSIYLSVHSFSCSYVNLFIPPSISLFLHL